MGLIVGGVLTAYLLFAMFIDTVTDDPVTTGNVLCVAFFGFGFAIVWYFLGFVYIVGAYDWSNFGYDECFWVYHFMYGLVIAPLVLLGIVVLILGLGCLFR